MSGNRGVLVTFLAMAFLATILFGFSDKLSAKRCDIGKLDACSRNGGFGR